MSGQFRSKESTARYLASWSKLSRNVAGRVQTLYAAVLDDGNIVRPVPVSRYTYPVRRSREKSEAAEEKTNENRGFEFSAKQQAAERWAVLNQRKTNGRFT